MPALMKLIEQFDPKTMQTSDKKRVFFTQVNADKHALGFPFNSSSLLTSFKPRLLRPKSGSCPNSRDPSSFFAPSICQVTLSGLNIMTFTRDVRQSACVLAILHGCSLRPGCVCGCAVSVCVWVCPYRPHRNRWTHGSQMVTDSHLLISLLCILHQLLFQLKITFNSIVFALRVQRNAVGIQPERAKSNKGGKRFQEQFISQYE